MNNISIIIFSIIIVSTVAGIVSSFFYGRKNAPINAQLDELYNTDISCEEAFRYLGLSNSVGGKKN